jgi:hypothetical protein
MQQCKVLRIPKGNGKYRTIYNPSCEMRREIRKCWSPILDIMMARCDYRLCHGFMPGRSPATNASYHLDYAYTLSMDLSDFFDTVTADKLRHAVCDSMLDVCLYEGAARQGLPSSPMLANIAAAPMDEELAALGVRYTRYADDLTFSGNDKETILTLPAVVGEIVDRYGFVVNQRKTHLQDSRGGRRIITGVAVDSAVHVTRKCRRKARAAKHQGHPGSAAGLIEWIGSPRLRCPLCWKPHSGCRFADVIETHFRHILPECCRARVYADRQCLRKHWMDMVVNRGGIQDYADLYEHLRTEYLIWGLSNA